MKKPIKIGLLATVFSMSASFSQAEIGITDACQEQVDELLEKINDNPDDYTPESRAKAKKHLIAAKAKRVEARKCRRHLMNARKELRKGK